MPNRPTQQDVLLALLAFDAYNRGVNELIKYGPGQNAKLAEVIGTASWIKSSDAIPGATNIGFSASHYTLSSGQTVISYR